MNYMWKKNRSFFLLCAMMAIPVQADPPEKISLCYRLDPKPIAKTPKRLGLNVEVMQNAESSNLWDWLADSGAQIVRVGHPDTAYRKETPNKKSVFYNIRDKADFENFRADLLKDPDSKIPWSQYRFDEEIPWLGTMDLIIQKLIETGIEPLVSIAYAPDYFPRPLLKKLSQKYQPSDESIDWGAAASAYEYYFATVFRYAKRYGVSRFMMLNEPPGDLTTIQNVGVIAKMGRMAIEDIQSISNKLGVTVPITLSGPAAYIYSEDYWPYVKDYVDFFDLHLYEPDSTVFTRKLLRGLSQSRLANKRMMLTEFNRIGGPTPIEESLFSIRASLQLGKLIMSSLSNARPEDPGIEAALVYQFQFPATHRNFKSLVYGDMNQLDWTGQDKRSKKNPQSTPPSFESLQLRFATPAYSIFKMFTRSCLNHSKEDDEGNEVFSLGEANLGVGAVSDPIHRRNVYPLLDSNKYFSCGGIGTDVQSLGIRQKDRFIVVIINAGPATIPDLGFNLSSLTDSYSCAVIRETSLFKRDQFVEQKTVKDNSLRCMIPPESMTEICFMKENLSKVEEIKLVERTTTPGNSSHLKYMQTTLFKALGRIQNRWIDLTSLNIEWESSDPDCLAVDQSGLVQAIKPISKEVKIIAKTPFKILAEKKITIGDL